MSFTTDVKKEMLEIWQKKDCCRNAELCGMLLFCRKKDKFRLNTSIHDNARHLRSLLRKCCDYQAQIITTKSGKYSLTIAENSVDGIANSFTDDLFICDNCKNAFIRGVFLCCGQLSDPKKEYRLDFISYDEQLSFTLCRILISLGFDAKTSMKADRFIVYIKKSGDIEDLLTFMGASNSALEIMQMQVVKDVRNNVNRQTNFVTANIKKSSQSCAKQLEAINKLSRAGRLETLPEDLYDLAIARQENIDMSLTELGQKFGLSRSGIHHRLQKLINLSEEI